VVAVSLVPLSPPVNFVAFDLERPAPDVEIGHEEGSWKRFPRICGHQILFRILR
jgi:hypothetical protein